MKDHFANTTMLLAVLAMPGFAQRVALPGVVMPPHLAAISSRSQLQSMDARLLNRTVKLQTRFRVAPIGGVTSAWHDVPSQLVVPATSLVTLELAVPMPHVVCWTGAIETSRLGDASRADVIEDGSGHTLVSADIFDLGGELRNTVSTEIRFAPFGFDASGVHDVSITETRWDTDTNSFREYEMPAPGAQQPLEVQVGEHENLTALAGDPAAPLAIEWSIDGRAVSLGTSLDLVFDEAGDHVVTVGPPGTQRALSFSAANPPSAGTLSFGHLRRKPIRWPGTLCFDACSLTAYAAFVPCPPPFLGCFNPSYLITFTLTNRGKCTTTFTVDATSVAPLGYEWDYSQPIGGTPPPFTYTLTPNAPSNSVSYSFYAQLKDIDSSSEPVLTSATVTLTANGDHGPAIMNGGSTCSVPVITKCVGTHCPGG